MFLLVLKLYQMDVAHAILFARKLDISRVTVHYLSAKFESYSLLLRKLDTLLWSHRFL